MTLNELFKQRVSLHQKQLFKYMKYVFNDHFVIALLILIGAAGFGYSDYVMTLEEGVILPPLVLVGVLTFFLSIGSVATLLKPADLAFILPKEEAFFSVLKRLTIRSFFILAFAISMASAIAMPLLVETNRMMYSQWALFFITMLGWKWIDLMIQVYIFQENCKQRRSWLGFISSFCTFIGLLISVFIGVSFGLFLSISVSILLWILFQSSTFKNRPLQWEEMIRAETNRLQTIYRFINLFTDVPFMDTQTKRLKFLDKWIQYFSTRQHNTYYYYLVRIFYRNTTYSGLAIRLTIIGSLLVLFSTNIILVILLSVLFLYLIGFQLIPLLQHVEYSLQFQLYPIEGTGKIEAIKRLIFEILLIASIVLSLSSYSLGFFEMVGIFVMNLAFSFVFSFLYLPRRIKKITKAL